MAFDWDTHLQRWWRQNFKAFRMSSYANVCYLWCSQPMAAKKFCVRGSSIKLAKLSKRHHLQERCWLPPMLANFDTSWCISEVDVVGSSSSTLAPAHFQSNWLNFRNIIISKHVVGFRPCWLNRKCHGAFPKLVVGDSSRPAWLLSIKCGQTFKTSFYPRTFLVFSRVGFRNIIIMLFVTTSHGT